MRRKHHWDLNRSYRVPGKIYPEKQVAVFDLVAARKIATEEEAEPARL